MTGQSLNWELLLPVFEKTVYGFLTVEAVYPKVSVTTTAESRFIIGKVIGSGQQLDNSINSSLTAPQVEELTEGFEVSDMQIAIKTFRKKYYIDDIDLKDRQYDTIDIASREMARALTETVDLELFRVLNTTTGVQSVAASGAWSTPTTSDPVNDVLTAVGLSRGQRGKPQALVVNTTDYMNALKSDAIQAVFNVGVDIVKQGDVSPFTGLDVYASPLVTQGTAFVLPKDVTWFYQREPLRTEVRQTAEALGSYLYAEVRGAFNIVYPQTVVKITGL